MVEDIAKLVDSKSVKPLWHSSGREVCSLVRSDAVWKTIVVDKTFCKVSDGSFGR